MNDIDSRRLEESKNWQDTVIRAKAAGITVSELIEKDGADLRKWLSNRTIKREAQLKAKGIERTPAWEAYVPNELLEIRERALTDGLDKSEGVLNGNTGLYCNIQDRLSSDETEARRALDRYALPAVMLGWFETIQLCDRIAEGVKPKDWATFKSIFGSGNNGFMGVFLQTIVTVVAEYTFSIAHDDAEKQKAIQSIKTHIEKLTQDMEKVKLQHVHDRSIWGDDFDSWGGYIGLGGIPNLYTTLKKFAVELDRLNKANGFLPYKRARKSTNKKGSTEQQRGLEGYVVNSLAMFIKLKSTDTQLPFVALGRIALIVAGRPTIVWETKDVKSRIKKVLLMRPKMRGGLSIPS
jgi:hypothetical protein